MAFKPSAEEIRRNLKAAWGALWLDRAALKAFGDSDEAFWQSFYCAFLMLPVYLASLMISPSFGQLVERLETGMGRLVVVELSFYAIFWCLWPLVAMRICLALDCVGGYIRYICTINWINGVMILVNFALTAADLIPFFSDAVLLSIQNALTLWPVIVHGILVYILLRQPAVYAALIALGEMILTLILVVAHVQMLSP